MGDISCKFCDEPASDRCASCHTLLCTVHCEHCPACHPPAPFESCTFPGCQDEGQRECVVCSAMSCKSHQPGNACAWCLFVNSTGTAAAQERAAAFITPYLAEIAKAAASGALGAPTDTQLEVAPARTGRLLRRSVPALTEGVWEIGPLRSRTSTTGSSDRASTTTSQGTHVLRTSGAYVATLMYGDFFLRRHAALGAHETVSAEQLANRWWQQSYSNATYRPAHGMLDERGEPQIDPPIDVRIATAQALRGSVETVARIAHRLGVADATLSHLNEGAARLLGPD